MTSIIAHGQDKIITNSHEGVRPGSVRLPFFYPPVAHMPDFWKRFPKEQEGNFTAKWYLIDSDFGITLSQYYYEKKGFKSKVKAYLYARRKAYWLDMRTRYTDHGVCWEVRSEQPCNK